nr:MAG TPA: hypothetical protein [Caudoviricetes sp.]
MQSWTASVYIIGTNVNGIRHRGGKNASRPHFTSQNGLLFS